ncbi:MAG: transglutaminase domain-containing protein, partial [Treponema sp.]|nr:transglutaminase domain-containing protein [Treponema sp.]
MTCEMIPSASGIKVKRILLALALLLTLCVSAFAQTNSAGLRYDPDAVVKSIKDGKKMSGFYVRVDTKNKVVFFYTDSKLKRQVGEYNLGEQYWEDWDSSKLDPLKIDYKAFYKKINTSKTSFMRTKDGTKITSAKPATPAKPSTAKAGTSSTSVKPGNSSSSTASGTSSSTGASNTSRTSGTTGTSSTSNTSTTSGTAGTSSASNTSTTSGTTGSSNTSASSSSSRTSSTGTQGTSSQQTPAATPAPTAYVPDAQKIDNLVFTARKHPVVTSYTAIDNAVKKISCPASMTPEDAAKKIVASAKTDMEKARALFSWIGYNIVYDYSFKKESYTAAGTWKNRTGVCEGYVLLYIQMAKAVGLYAECVSGYAKNTDDYNPGNPLEKHG